MTLRVTLLLRSLGHGGTERQALLLARGLQTRGVDVKIVTLYSSPCPIDSTGGLEVYSLGKRHRWDLLALLRLHRFIQREAPHVLYSFLNVSNVLAALGALMRRRFHLVWGVRCSDMDLADYDWLVRTFDWLELRLSRMPDLIISNSFAGHDYAVARGLPKAKLHVVCNGFDTELFHPNAEARREVRAGWGVVGTAPVIGMVARLDPTKDHATFLRAASLLARDRPDARFVLVGDGPSGYRASLRGLARRFGLGPRVIWEYRRSDMPRFYPALDVLCCSSRSEGFPNALGEAMACATPCVTTDVGDARRIVSESGVVVPPRDPQALACGMQTMLQRLERGDLRDAAGRIEATRGRVARQFSLERMIDETEHAFRTLTASVLADAKLS